MNDYVMSFFSMEIGYILVVCFLAYRMTMSVGTVEEIRHFRRLQMFYVVQCTSQLLWMADASGLIRASLLQSWIVNMTYGIAFGLSVYEWFLFIASKLRGQAPEEVLRFTRMLQRIVVLVHVTLFLTSYWTKWMFFIDEQGQYIRGSLFWINQIACYSHWLMATVILLSCLRSASQLERTQIRRLLMISALPVLGGILQYRIYNIPFLDTGLVLATIFLFVYLQESQIRSDALTGLNNRAQYNIAFEQRLSRVPAEPFLLFVADVDRFKQINDTYGHLMGDQVLKLIAKSLKKLGGKYHTLGIYRYGGDEFVLLIRARDLPDVEGFCEELNERLQSEITDAWLGFAVRCTIGYSLVRTAEEGAGAFKAAEPSRRRTRCSIPGSTRQSNDTCRS